MLSREDDREIERAVERLVGWVGEHNEKPKPVILHSLRVGLHLYALGYGKSPVIAGVLHDVLEASDATAEQIESEFGPEVALLVKANSHNESIQDPTEQYIDTFRRCVEAGPYALAIKAADLTDNLQGLPQEPDHEKRSRHLEKAAFFLGITRDPLGGASIRKELRKVYDRARKAENGSEAEDAGRPEASLSGPVRDDTDPRGRVLLVLRHGKAKAESPKGDKERELSKRGRNDSVAMGRVLVSVAPPIDMVVSSEALRALETAHLVAASAGFEGSINTDEAIYGADAEVLLEVVQNLPDAAQCVLMVGHNPGFEDLASALCGTSDFDVTLATASVALIELGPNPWSEAGPGSGKLVGVHTPHDE